MDINSVLMPLCIKRVWDLLVEKNGVDIQSKRVQFAPKVNVDAAFLPVETLRMQVPINLLEFLNKNSFLVNKKIKTHSWGEIGKDLQLVFPITIYQ